MNSLTVNGRRVLDRVSWVAGTVAVAALGATGVLTGCAAPELTPAEREAYVGALDKDAEPVSRADAFLAAYEATLDGITLRTDAQSRAELIDAAWNVCATLEEDDVLTGGQVAVWNMWVDEFGRDDQFWPLSVQYFCPGMADRLEETVGWADWIGEMDGR